MREKIFFILMLVCISVNAQRASVRTEKAGTLSKVLTDYQKKNLVSLKISGPINGTDIRLLQCMLSQKKTPELIKGKLKQLDLENARIVSGGKESDVYIGSIMDLFLVDDFEEDKKEDLYDLTGVKTEDDIMGYEIFKECQLESIILPNTLKEINDKAFSDNENLSYIKIPKSVIQIGWSIFQNCPCLVSINVDVDSNSFVSVDGILFSKDRKRLVNYPCGKIGDYVIPDGTEDIYGAFNGCKYITSITIPKSIEKVEEHDYFDGCKFKTVYIQGATKGAQYIPCTEKYIVNEDNQEYSTIDGVLYDKAKKILLRFPPFCQATSTYDTEIIGYGAFCDCNFLTSIRIDPPTREIRRRAFGWCRNLRAIKIPSSVTEIKKDAFHGCDNLLDIYFEGIVPPGQHNYRRTNSEVVPFSIDNSKCVLHVPKGSKDSYQKLWPKHIVVEE